MNTAANERSPLACLYHWEKTRPDTVHFTQPLGQGRMAEYTWAQAMAQARRMAAHLQSLQLPAGSKIAILGKNSAHWIMADWAIWMAGHVSVPLYPTLNAETVRYILEHCEARLLFIGKLDDWPMMAPGVPDRLPRIRLPLSPEIDAPQWDALIGEHEPLRASPDCDPDALATIVYTSGSTGQPKGVMQSFRSLQRCGTLLSELIPVSDQDRMLSYLPLAHVAERLCVQNLSTYYGFQVFFAESLETFVSDLKRARPTIFFSVPRLWTKFHLAVCDKLPLHKQRLLFRIPFLGRRIKRRILEQLGLQDVRVAVTGAAPLPPPIVAWYRSLGLDLLEAYGMSENCAYSHFTRPGDSRIGYVGPPNPGVSCRIADNGEILVKSPAQMMGYYLAPEATAAAYSEGGYFRTGDMGELDERQRLRITGRVKELFKTSKGKYVAPVPIENKLGAHPKLEVVCVGGANQAATFALVQLAEDSRAQLAQDAQARQALSEDLQGLLGAVNETLDPHEQLQFICVAQQPWTIDNGFLTPTMKIRRNIIEKHYEPQLGDWYAQRKPVIWEGLR